MKIEATRNIQRKICKRTTTIESFRFEDENKYKIWLPIFSINTWKIYNTDDESYFLLAV